MAERKTVEVFAFHMNRLMYSVKMKTREMLTIVSKEEYLKIVSKMNDLIAFKEMLFVSSEYIADLGPLVRKFKIVEKFLVERQVMEKVGRGKYRAMEKNSFVTATLNAWDSFRKEQS